MRQLFAILLVFHPQRLLLLRPLRHRALLPYIFAVRSFSTAANSSWFFLRDAGMATVDHTPKGRGYDTSFGYFHHANDCESPRLEAKCFGQPIPQ